MVAALKSRSSWAAAAVAPAANVARPETRSRRLSEPRSKRVNRLEMIDSMAMSFRSKDGAGGKIIARRAELRSVFRRLRSHGGLRLRLIRAAGCEQQQAGRTVT